MPDRPKRIRECWQCGKVAERHTHKGDGYEIRHQEDGLDEVIAHGATVHLEQMSETWYWLGIDLPDGTHLRVTVGAVNERSHVQATVEVEPPHTYEPGHAAHEAGEEMPGRTEPHTSQNSERGQEKKSCDIPQ